MIEHPLMSEAAAAELLEEYQAGSSCFFASPRGTMLAEGVAAVIPGEQGPDALKRLPGLVAAALETAKKSGQGVPLVVGAVPFDDTHSPRLVVPAAVRWASPLQLPAAGEEAGMSKTSWTIREEPEAAAYELGVRRALERLEAGSLSKVVLSRTLRLTAEQPVHVQLLLRSLARSNPLGYTFAVDLPARAAELSVAGEAAAGEAPRTLIGASPELLLRKKGPHVISNPLAGSIPRSGDPEEDARRTAGLLASAKDRHEHAVVVEAVAAALKPYCRKLLVPAGPSLVQTETMWHLSTEITGELYDPSVTSVELAAALHPTPAVCGTPTALARETIRDIEPFEREFYTGMVGWCDAQGDGEWAVTIRCAEVAGQTLLLYAGAGIVVGSVPEAELAETSAKFRTLLRAMGAGDE